MTDAPGLPEETALNYESIKLTMDGEYIDDAEPVIGYGHRMHEKMGENRTYAKFLPNTARMDYVAAMFAAPPHDLVAVEFTPETAFDQTPGPRAGAPLHTP